jgi:rhodanese-related sulfurtransferase
MAERISAEQAQEEIKTNQAILVDVREEDELLNEGIAEPAVWMPMSQIAAGDPAYQKFLSTLSKDKKVIIYCHAGGRAGRFAAHLTQQGYKAANMGGLSDWVDANLPVKPWQTR